MILGLDACASLQGPIDWTEVRGSSRMFAFLKATEGSRGTEDLDGYVPAARDAGLLVGFYAVLRMHEEPEPQIEHLLRHVGPHLALPHLPLVLDVEVPGNRPNESLVEAWKRYGIDPPTVRDRLVRAARRCAQLHRAPIVYWNRSWASSCDSTKLAVDVIASPLWQAAWRAPTPGGLTHDPDWLPASPPPALAPWTRTAFDQHGGLGQPGCARPCDQDVFWGSIDQLRELALLPPEERGEEIPDTERPTGPIPMPGDVVDEAVLAFQRRRGTDRDSDE